MAIVKPPHGSPCNSCGLCCRAQLCPLAQLMFGRENGPCPAIERDGERELCGLVRSPGNHAVSLTMIHGAAKMRDAALLLIGSGVGCDAVDYGERPNLAYKASLRRTAGSTRKVEAALRTWGVAR